MKISIKGIGVLGGFGAGLTMLENALARPKEMVTTVSMESSQGQIEVPALLAGPQRPCFPAGSMAPLHGCSANRLPYKAQGIQHGTGLSVSARAARGDQPQHDADYDQSAHRRNQNP